MLDFEGILTAQAYNRRVRQEIAAADAWQDRAETSEAELATSQVEYAANEAGRLAQIKGLLAAMRAVSPNDPVFQKTGKTFESGQAEEVWHVPYFNAYDAVADANGLRRTQRGMTKAERAAAAEAQVLAEPIKAVWPLFTKKWRWRGVDYRTAEIALKVRADAARLAREALV